MSPRSPTRPPGWPATGPSRQACPGRSLTAAGASRLAAPTCTSPSTPPGAPPTAVTTSWRSTATGPRSRPGLPRPPPRQARPQPPRPGCGPRWQPPCARPRRIPPGSQTARRSPRSTRTARNGGGPPARLRTEVAAALRQAEKDPAGISDGEALALLDADGEELEALAALADAVRRDVAEDDITYVVNRNINFTNVCYTGCRFCAFAQRRTDADAYTLSLEQIGDRAQE